MSSINVVSVLGKRKPTCPLCRDPIKFFFLALDNERDKENDEKRTITGMQDEFLRPTTGTLEKDELLLTVKLQISNRKIASLESELKRKSTSGYHLSSSAHAAKPQEGRMRSSEDDDDVSTLLQAANAQVTHL